MLKLENSIRGLSFSRVAFDLTIQDNKKRIANRNGLTIRLYTEVFMNDLFILYSYLSISILSVIQFLYEHIYCFL